MPVPTEMGTRPSCPASWIPWMSWVGNCYLAISFDASDQIIWFQYVAFSVVFDDFCMKWLWLAITILCMSVHVSILSWSKLDLAAAGQTWTSPFRSFVLRGKGPPCEKGKESCPFETDLFPMYHSSQFHEPYWPYSKRYKKMISLPTCCKCLRWVPCMLLCCDTCDTCVFLLAQANLPISPFRLALDFNRHAWTRFNSGRSMWKSDWCQVLGGAPPGHQKWHRNHP